MQQQRVVITAANCRMCCLENACQRVPCSVAQAKAQEDGLVFISAFDDPWIVAGTGTMGLEILRNCSAQHLKQLHAIFVPVGGGGMLAGIASYVKAVNPDIKVYGVEPTGQDMQLSYLNHSIK